MSRTTPRVWHRFTLAVVACAGAMCMPSIPAIPLVGGALLFSGLCQDAIAAHIYYVNGATGIDVNTGQTAAQSLKTLDALPALADFDLVYVAGPLRSNAALFTGAATGGAAVLNISGRSNVTIAQMPGAPTAEFRGDTQLVQAGWVASGSAYTFTLTGAPATAPDASVANWDANIDANGHHAGHMIPDSAANCITPPDGKGRFNFNTSTKVYTVYLGGDNPNTCGYPIGVCWVPSSPGTPTGAITFTNGSDNTVYGINFALYPSIGATGQTGWGIAFISSPRGTAVGCTARDMGAHPFGSYASGSSSSDCYFVSCWAQSGRAGGGGAFIEYTTSAFTLMARHTNCVVDAYQYLGTDGATRATGSTAMDAFSGNGFDAHADSGTPIRDILNTGCGVRYYQDPGANWQAFNGANTVAPTSGSSWDTYSVRCDQCFITGHNQEYYTGGNVAFRRCQFQQTYLLAEGGGGTRGAWTLWTGAADGTLCFVACTFIVNLADSAGGGNVTRAFSCNSNSGNSYMHFANCSGWDIATNRSNSVIQNPANFHGWFDYVGVNANLFRCYRCVWGSAGGAGTAQALCFGDAGTSVANHTFVNGAYYGVNDANSRFSQNGTIATAAGFINTSTGADTKGIILSVAPYTNAPTDLRLTPLSPLFPIRATDTSFYPPFGIDGVNRGFLGAHQPPFFAGRRGRRAA